MALAPALANTTSILPNADRAFSTAASIAFTSRKSVCNGSRLGPSAAAASYSVSWFRPAIATFAPSAMNRLAVASPMPLLPPVIKVTLPVSLMMTPHVI